MSLKRTVYRFAGNDYEQNQVVKFDFNVQRVSIQNFLNLLTDCRIFNKTISKEYFQDNHRTDTDGLMKFISVKCYPEKLVQMLNSLGINDFNNVEKCYINVRHHFLRAYDGVKNTRYDGISVYDPKTRKTYFRSNSPVLIEGNQKIINGKLWRKYYTSNPIK